MTAVFLDLDGTLMESHTGILSSLTHAFRSTGYPDIAEQDLTWLIGPPFVDSFAKLGIGDPAPVLDAYRTHYRSGGMFDARVYDGIFPALQALKAAGYRLYLATAKPIDYAAEITAHFGLSDYMTAEFGPELDGTRNWKGDLLAHALKTTGETAERSVMVGDRHHDIGAALEVGMASVAVRWGYGTTEDWQGAGALIDHPRDLASTVSQLLT
jgi:phosphoglycolate phosphatase